MVDFAHGSNSTVLRKEVVDSMVKQTAARTYKFRQALAVVPTSAWTNTFFREDLTVLSGAFGLGVEIPRGANFPQASPKWEEVSTRIIKFGLESNIPWESILSSDFNVQSRTIIRITEGVVKGVDDRQWDGLTQASKDNDRLPGGDAGNIRIQSFALLYDKSWNGGSSAIIDDIFRASELIATKGNYDVSNLICFISPRDKRSILNYMANKGSQWMPIATDIAKNGRIGRIAGVTLVESQSVTASYALVVKPKTIATWKALVPLRSTTIEDPYKSLTIRVVEEGVLELTDPLAAVLIKGTQKAEES